MRSLVIVLAAALAACGHLGKRKPQPEPRTPTEQAAAFGATEGGRVAPGTGAQAKGQVAGPSGRAPTGEHGPSPTEALRVVGEAADALRTGRGEPLAAAAGGVQALSVLVRAAAGETSEVPDMLSRRAGEIRAQPPSAADSTASVSGLLTDGLDAATLADPDVANDPSVRRARRAIGALDPSVPLARQAEPAAAALCATGEALGVAARLPQAASQLSSCAEVPPTQPGTPEAARAELEQLRATTAHLGQASWEQARAASASLLDQLAAAYEAAGLPRYHADALRARAKELRDLDQLSLQGSDRVKEALGTALAGLDALARSRPALQSWVASAGRAVRAIDPRVPFGLERAAIQDAARALVDAFAAAVTLDQSCR